MSYVAQLDPPEILSREEVKAILTITGEHRSGFRDHVLFFMALSTALRQFELMALNWGDLLTEDGNIRHVVHLKRWKSSNDKKSMQKVRLPSSLRAKLLQLRKNNIRDGIPAQKRSPVFVSARKQRMSLRTVRFVWALWKERAGIDREISFHSLRHTAISHFYRACRDVMMTAQFARHASIKSTQRYVHIHDDDVSAIVERIF